MPWNGSAPNQTFGRSNGDHTGSLVWQTDDAESFDITSSRHDAHDQDMGDAINSCLKKDGGNTATSNIPMGGFKFTNLAAGSARTDSIRLGQVQDSSATYYPTVGGTADAITLTGASAAITAYAAGQTFVFKAAATNTGAVTVNIDGVGAKSITGPAGAALTAGQIVINTMVTITYDGTQFQINTTAAVAISVGTVMGWPMTTIPTGWLECDGSAISRTTYAALFAVYGTAYGPGNGSTTFNLPNYKDYFLRGFDASGTDAGSRTDRGDGTTGAAVGTKQAGATKEHTHGPGTLAGPLPNHVHSTFDVVDSGAHAVTSVAPTVTKSGSTVTGNPTTNPNVEMTSGVTATTGDSANETRPKNITIKWIALAQPAAALPAYGGGVPAATGYTVSPRNIHTGFNPATAAADGTNLDAVVTELYVAEVFIPSNVTVTGVAPFWGANTNGNAKVMLFDSSGTRVAMSASTDVSGHTADSYTRIPFSAAYDAVGPATYYVGIICDDANHDLNTHVVGNFGAGKITGLVYATEAGYASITPPTTFTTGLGPIASLY
jgi:microcystin-dependent protein